MRTPLISKGRCAIIALKDSSGILPTIRAAADENAENQNKIDNYESVIRSITGK